LPESYLPTNALLYIIII